MITKHLLPAALIGSLALSPTISMAQTNSPQQKPNYTLKTSHNSNNCWENSGAKHGIDAWLLMAIGSVESSLRHGIVSKNTNGSYDMGIMQINTIHLPYFNKMGYSRNELVNNSCKNIEAAGFILKSCLQKYGNNINGIGCYHSQTPHRRVTYGHKVLKEYKRLVSQHYRGVTKVQPAQHGGTVTTRQPQQQVQPKPIRTYIVKASYQQAAEQPNKYQYRVVKSPSKLKQGGNYRKIKKNNKKQTVYKYKPLTTKQVQTTYKNKYKTNKPVQNIKRKQVVKSKSINKIRNYPVQQKNNNRSNSKYKARLK